ncbi:MAG: RDD family protein [Candidatus Omnitrophica bacterium]|nr:RDD family protein [Candidatus Omnitrophota bacterium]
MDFNMPGPNKRVCAYFIDAIIITAIGIVVSLMFSMNLYWIIYVLLILFKDSFNGQSFGKYLVGTQIVDENNSPASISKAAIRNIFMAIPFFPIIEYFVMLNDKQEGRRIGDRVVKTRVNDLKPELKDSIFLLISLVLVVIYVAVVLGYTYTLIKLDPSLIKQ